MMAIVEAAELLDLVDTPKRMVVLDAVGPQFLKASPAERKNIWREQLLKLEIFRLVSKVLDQQPSHSVGRDFLLETFILRLPTENYERVFETLIGWARYGN